MKFRGTPESGRSFLAVAVNWLFDRTHPALHWAIVPIIFGLVLAGPMCLVLFLGELLHTGQISAKTFAVLMLFLCAAASVGGLGGGLLFHTVNLRYPLRLILCWTVSGLITGLTLAALLQFFLNHDENQMWVSGFFILAGLLAGLTLGVWFAHASRQNAA